MCLPLLYLDVLAWLFFFFQSDVLYLTFIPSFSLSMLVYSLLPAFKESVYGTWRELGRVVNCEMTRDNLQKTSSNVRKMSNHLAVGQLLTAKLVCRQKDRLHKLFTAIEQEVQSDLAVRENALNIYWPFAKKCTPGLRSMG